MAEECAHCDSDKLVTVNIESFDISNVNTPDLKIPEFLSQDMMTLPTRGVYCLQCGLMSGVWEKVYYYIEQRDSNRNDKNCFGKTNKWSVVARKKWCGLNYLKEDVSVLPLKEFNNLSTEDEIRAFEMLYPQLDGKFISKSIQSLQETKGVDYPAKIDYPWWKW